MLCVDLAHDTIFGTEYDWHGDMLVLKG